MKRWLLTEWKTRIGYLCLLVLSWVLGVTSAHAQEELGRAASDYGELYLLEQRKGLDHSVELAILPGYEFSNAFYQVYSVSIDAKKSVWNAMAFGARFSKFFVSKNSVSSSVESLLRASDAPRTVLKPNYSVYGTVSLIPFSGHLNFFSRSSLPVSLLVEVGPGMTQYTNGDREFASIWEIGIQVGVSHTVFTQIGFGQEMEAPFTNNVVFRTQGRLGLGVRL